MNWKKEVEKILAEELRLFEVHLDRSLKNVVESQERMLSNVYHDNMVNFSLSIDSCFKLCYEYCFVL